MGSCPDTHNYCSLSDSKNKNRPIKCKPPNKWNEFLYENKGTVQRDPGGPRIITTLRNMYRQQQQSLGDEKEDIKTRQTAACKLTRDRLNNRVVRSAVLTILDDSRLQHNDDSFTTSSNMAVNVRIHIALKLKNTGKLKKASCDICSVTNPIRCPQHIRIKENFAGKDLNRHNVTRLFRIINDDVYQSKLIIPEIVIPKGKVPECKQSEGLASLSRIVMKVVCVHRFMSPEPLSPLIKTTMMISICYGSYVTASNRSISWII